MVSVSGRPVKRDRPSNAILHGTACADTGVCNRAESENRTEQRIDVNDAHTRAVTWHDTYTATYTALNQYDTSKSSEWIKVIKVKKRGGDWLVGAHACHTTPHPPPHFPFFYTVRHLQELLWQALTLHCLPVGQTADKPIDYSHLILIHLLVDWLTVQLIWLI